MSTTTNTRPAVDPQRLHDLHAASLRLLNLLAVHGVEEELLQKGIESLASLIGARYGAIGVVDEAGKLQQFVYTGISPEEAARIGRLPEGKGLLGVVIQENHALHLDDMARDLRAVGFPPHHPPMKSLLAVPVSHAGAVYGRVYLSEKADGAPFTEEDELLVTRFAEALALTLRFHRTEAERRRTYTVLQEVAHAVSAVTGEAFFRSLVVDLAKALRLDYVFVGEVGAHDERIIQTLAFCDHGHIADNIEYQLVPATVCGSVQCKAVCHFPKGAQQLYPEDEILSEFRVEAFIGHPLLDAAGKVLGLLAVMHRKPIADHEHVQSLLQICAARAASELERLHADKARQHAEAALRASEEDLRALTENANDGILVNSDGQHVFANRRLADMLGYTLEELRHTGMKELVHPDEYDKVASRFRARMADEAVPAQYETVFVAKDGAAVPVELNAARTVWQGRPAGLVFVRDIRARKQAEAEMRKLASAVEQTADAVVVTNADGFIEYVNPAFERHTGYRREEVVGRTPAVVKSGVHDKAFYRELWATLGRGEAFRAVFVNRRKDGTLFHEEKTIAPLKDEQGRIAHFVSTGRDITERKQAEDKIARLGRILDDSSNEIYVFDAASLRFVQVNHGAQRNLGYTMDELKDLTPVDIKPEFTKERFEALVAPLRRGETDRLTFATVYRRKDGSDYPVEVQLQLMRHETPPVFVAIIQDITERKQSEARLSYLAYYDTLTGLPNRARLLERLQQAMLDAGRVNRLVAVMFLDLDRFKYINDTLGHATGDALLRAVAERLKSGVRPGDIIARLGGDEFTVALANVAHVDDVARVARKLLASFEKPFHIDGKELFTSTSIGITLYPLDEQGPEGLLKNADAAMYHAKERGRNNFQFFTAELNVRAERRLRIESALRQALARNELSLHYQPQVDTKTGRLTGMEALLRWQHPELGNVSPVEFIPVAEETGLILSIGEWVLREACRQTKAWHHTKFSFSKMQVAVNISGKQLRQKDFPDLVRQVLDETGLEPRYLDLELTESLLMEDVEQTGDAMHTLHDMGVSFSVDDFGTGYSSLSYLKRFPIDVLKVDRGFVRDIVSDPNDAAIVKTIIAMAHTLGMHVIAEGVETFEQLQFLRAQGCDGSQGYYCSMPLAAGEFSALLADWGRIRQGKCRPAPRPARAPRRAGTRKARPAARGRRQRIAKK